MGWITTHRDKGQSHQQFFRAQGLFGEHHEVLAESTIKNVYYAAVRDNRSAEVFAIVILIQRAPNSYHNFGWKDMDETMGPNEAQAPAKVLDVLTPTTHEYALQWRAQCRANLARKAALPKLTPGQRIRFSAPIKFSDGVSRQEFTLIGRSGFRALDGARVSMPNWREMTFEIV